MIAAGLPCTALADDPKLETIVVTANAQDTERDNTQRISIDTIRAYDKETVVDLNGLPEMIGKTRLRDAENYFTATEMAGFGFAINTQSLTKLGIAIPKSWRDLTNPKLAGQIAVPNPARVGFAPVLIDIPLQGYGWESGWALWSEISGNADLFENAQLQQEAL